MSEREILIELIQKSVDGCARNWAEKIADYLLGYGVIVPPVKVGDKVYRISFTRVTRMKYIQETTISRVAIDCDGLWLFCSCNPIAKCKFGELVFLTKEEAEKALKGGATNE